MDSATPVYIPDIPLPPVVIVEDCTVALDATMMLHVAVLPTTETALALAIVPPPEQLILAPILADIMTLKFASVSTIRARVSLLTTTRTASATGIGTQVSREKVARLSKDITHTEQMRTDSTAMRVIFRNYSTAVCG